MRSEWQKQVCKCGCHDREYTPSPLPPSLSANGPIPRWEPSVVDTCGEKEEWWKGRGGERERWRIMGDEQEIMNAPWQGELMTLLGWCEGLGTADRCLERWGGGWKEGGGYRCGGSVKVIKVRRGMNNITILLSFQNQGLKIYCKKKNKIKTKEQLIYKKIQSRENEVKKG